MEAVKVGSNTGIGSATTGTQTIALPAPKVGVTYTFVTVDTADQIFNVETVASSPVKAAWVDAAVVESIIIGINSKNPTNIPSIKITAPSLFNCIIKT